MISPQMDEDEENFMKTLRKYFDLSPESARYAKSLALLTLIEDLWVIPRDAVLHAYNSQTIGALICTESCKVVTCVVPHRKHFCHNCKSIDSDHFSSKCPMKIKK